jgi:PHD/YefM family antitoxin component YafN of YafNO toxin-antitoxin module
MRNSRKIFEKVKQTGQPVVVINRKEPQVAIIRLEDLKELEQQRMKNSVRAALQFAKNMRQLLHGEKLPQDLAQNHDYYLWEAEPQKQP